MNHVAGGGQVPSDIAGLKAVLDALDGIWREAGIEYPAGLSDDVIDRECAGLPFTLADEVRAWFAWHEIPRPRQPPWDDTKVGASFMCFISLDQALDQWWLRYRLAAAEAVMSRCSRAEAGWDLTWFPIMRDISGGLVAVDCSVAPGVAAPVRVIHKGDPPEPVDFESLNELVEGWLSLYRAGIYEWLDGAWSHEKGMRTDYPAAIDTDKVPLKMKDVF